MAHYLNPHHGPCGHLIRPGTPCRACGRAKGGVSPAGFLAAYGYPRPGTCGMLLAPEKPCGKPAVDRFCAEHQRVYERQSLFWETSEL